jgi:hypothetical protein
LAIDENYVWEYEPDVSKDGDAVLTHFALARDAVAGMLDLRLHLGGIEVPTALIEAVVSGDGYGPPHRRLALAMFAQHVNRVNDLGGRVPPEMQWGADVSGWYDPAAAVAAIGRMTPVVVARLTRLGHGPEFLAAFQRATGHRRTE